MQQRKPQPATGHAFIDFELNGISTLTNIDAQIETKVKQLTQRELTRHQHELKTLVESRTSTLRDYVEEQMKSQQVTMTGLKGDVKK